METQIESRITAFFKKTGAQQIEVKIVKDENGNKLRYTISSGDPANFYTNSIATSIADVLGISWLEEQGLKMLHNKTKQQAEDEVEAWLFKGLCDEALAQFVNSTSISLLIKNTAPLSYFACKNGVAYKPINILDLITKYQT